MAPQETRYCLPHPLPGSGAVIRRRYPHRVHAHHLRATTFMAYALCRSAPRPFEAELGDMRDTLSGMIIQSGGKYDRERL